jgi:hypothetical protein
VSNWLARARTVRPRISARGAVSVSGSLSYVLSISLLDHWSISVGAKPGCIRFARFSIPSSHSIALGTDPLPRHSLFLFFSFGTNLISRSCTELLYSQERSCSSIELRKGATDLKFEVNILELNLYGRVALHWRDRMHI